MRVEAWKAMARDVLEGRKSKVDGKIKALPHPPEPVVSRSANGWEMRAGDIAHARKARVEAAFRLAGSRSGLFKAK